MVLEGYAADAGLPKASISAATIEAEAEAAGVNFAARLAQDLDALVARQAARHTGWFTHFFYESLLLVMVGFLLFRLGKNFFYDSWWSGNAAPTWGLESYFASAFWLLLWCFLLLWLFTRRLRRAEAGDRSLGRELDRRIAGRRAIRAPGRRLPPRGRV